MKRVRAFGPACIGNLAAGFDVLGAALAPVAEAGGVLWGDLVEVWEEPSAGQSSAGRFQLTCGGPFAFQLPADPACNLVVQACLAFERRWRPLPPLGIQLHKGLPVASGLGSSSASVVATVRALDTLFDHPLDADQLLGAAGEAEAQASGAVHLDNVAPALLGGVRLIAPAGDAVALPFPEELRFVVASPALKLTTRAARAVLPESVPLGLAVAHAQNLAGLVHALGTGDRRLLRACLKDVLAEPHRAALVPGFRAVQAAALAVGAWGCSLSGAGPAVFAVAEAAPAAATGEAMKRAWGAAGVDSTVVIGTVDHRGARIVDER